MAPPSSDSDSEGDDSASLHPAPNRRAHHFMKYPHPETERVLGLLETLPSVKEESKRCIARLLDYRVEPTCVRFPRGQSAAVLVPLFVGRSGDLYVLLSRRSDALRAYAGDTALPGGKVDAQDVTVEDTARREAFEEIGLPQDKERLPLLCVMEPHLAKGTMLVTPVVVLILDHNLQPNLNSSEVTSIFARPLVSFLSSTPYLSGGRMTDLNVPYHTFTDLPWSKGGTVRMHKFLTGREAEGVKPVFGLTASILIKTATIGYGRPPEFEVQPPDAPTPVQQIAHALLTPTNPIRIACEREGIDANMTAARLLHPPTTANAVRIMEWKKIGAEWKRLMNGSDSTADIPARTDATLGEATGPGSGSWERNSGDAGLHKRGEETKARVQGQVDNGGEKRLEGFDAKIDDQRECKEHAARDGEERQSAVSGWAKLGKFLDETRDMVNERLKEVKSDENKLAKARKIYPKIMERVRKQLEGARNENGELDLKELFSMIPKDGGEGLRGGSEANEEGIKRERGHVGDSEGIDRGKEGTRRGLEEMKKHIGKANDEHNPELALRRKRDAKL